MKKEFPLKIRKLCWSKRLQYIDNETASNGGFFYLKINRQISALKKQTHLFFFQNFKGKIYQKTG